MRRLTVLLLLALGGCASPARREAAAALDYARGYREAVQEQYWIIQNQQRRAAPAPENP